MIDQIFYRTRMELIEYILFVGACTGFCFGFSIFFSVSNIHSMIISLVHRYFYGENNNSGTEIFDYDYMKYNCMNYDHSNKRDCLLTRNELDIVIMKFSSKLLSNEKSIQEWIEQWIFIVVKWTVFDYIER